MVSTTTAREARLLVNSIRYRERLCQELPYLKSQLYDYVEEHGGVAYLGGYEVQAARGELRFIELETPDWQQLRLGLDGNSSSDAPPFDR